MHIDPTKDPAMVAWFAKASSNNTGHLASGGFKSPSRI